MEPHESYVSLFKLCGSIIDKIEEKDAENARDILSCIDGLRYLCHGKLNERDCFSYHSPDEKLISLIVIADQGGILMENPNICSDTIHSLLNYTYLNDEICKGLKILISTSYKTKVNNRSTIEKLFNHKDFASVSVELMEELCRFDLSNIQTHLVKLFMDVYDKSWDSESTRHWIPWCCKSSLLFCKLCALMNQALLIVKNKDNIIYIINNFIKNVRHYCDNNSLDFVNLYPIKLQPLVSFMCLDVDTLPGNWASASIDYVSVRINLLRKESPTDAVLLLTHFVQWQKVL